MAKKKASVKAKSTAKSSLKKAAAKKPVVKKAAKKPVKKTIKKVVKKAVKKVAAKAAKKTTKKVLKKTAKKAATKTGAKTVKPATPVAAKKQSQSLQALVSPLDDRILVRLSEIERRTPGGLFIPDSVTQTSGNLEGQVVAVGRGHMNKKGHVKPMDVQIGDKVLFAEFSGSKIKIQNEDLIILRESEVMGVVSK